VERYIKALDESLLEYHSQKMQEINQSIHEMWQSIYRGNDIESIAIRAEGGATSNAAYNYRVTMRKDGVELDMATRCSAGQKMIASLIIRLALAETFATNCGIIALDEPTTNLDGFNVDNLSDAINTLVERRKNPGSKPFQLIVISHSNYFVDLLMKGGNLDHFWQVRRETDDLHHYSAIYKCDPSYLCFDGN
jgi:DNA repair protein RAD50